MIASTIVNREAQRRLTIIGFLVVPLVLLAMFSLYPLCQLIWYSLNEWNGMSETKTFVGLSNYKTLLIDDRSLLEPLINSVYYFSGSLIQLVLATYFAVILSRKIPLASSYRTLLFLPYVLNAVAVSIVFREFLKIDGGLDDVLLRLGLESWRLDWVQDTEVVKWSLVFASVWRYLGFQLLITYGALQSVPQDQYEAARIEGASDWQQFWYITLPCISPILGLQVILATVGSLEVFEVPFLITGGANGTKTFIMATLDEAFLFQRVGLAAAMAIVLLCFVMLVMFIQRLVFGGKQEFT